ncbi:hypothetical protein [Paenibacillus sp. FSL R7-0331]|uniref:hypothetical protein n=1 Tax=Paenibacillus sp. FSL R7-0331 TaxID=1536773 RepID=UPI0004F723E3|nr:hypothetical protein [Paenibacillus sp. FSL R7-0331]AIQ50678.1 hypothetical protein R70331_03410 [Paenibacillus sp. FSL R7-0331]
MAKPQKNSEAGKIEHDRQNEQQIAELEKEIQRKDKLIAEMQEEIAIRKAAIKFFGESKGSD